MNLIRILALTFSLTQTLAYAEIDAKKLAPLSSDQVQMLIQDAKTFTKTQKWDLVNPVVSLEIKKDSQIHSAKLPGEVHALWLDYSEKQMRSDVSGKNVDVQGDISRSILGIKLKSEFKILKDSAYFQRECEATDIEYTALEPLVVNQKPLLAFTELTHVAGCAGATDHKGEVLILLDPEQNYTQVLAVPVLKKKNREVLMSAKFSVGKGNLLEIKRGTTLEKYTWNKEKTKLELITQ